MLKTVRVFLLFKTFWVRLISCPGTVRVIWRGTLVIIHYPFEKKKTVCVVSGVVFLLKLMTTPVGSYCSSRTQDFNAILQERYELSNRSRGKPVFYDGNCNGMNEI